jgi:hypothetical protein
MDGATNGRASKTMMSIRDRTQRVEAANREAAKRHRQRQEQAYLSFKHKPIEPPKTAGSGADALLVVLAQIIGLALLVAIVKWVLLEP